MRYLPLILVVCLLLVGCRTANPTPTPPSISPTTGIEPTALPPDIPTAVVTGESQVDQPVVEAATLEPTAIPLFVPTLTQLTQPGCCVQPFWSPEGDMVYFIDKPQPTANVGIYGVPLTGGEPQLIRERIGIPSRNGHYHTFLNEAGETVVEPLDRAVEWVIPNGGLRVFLSPNGLRLAWAETNRSGNFDQRPTTIYVSDIDGSDVVELITLYGGGFAGWMDDDHLLLSGKDASGSENVTMFTYNVLDGTRVDLISNQRIRSVDVSRGGAWIVYSIMLDPDGAEDDGLWVVNRDGSQRYKLEVFGASRWRDDTHLLIIPLEVDVESHRLWEFDATTGEVYPVTDPAQTPFKVSNGDWSVSPNGNHVVFFGEDQSLWMITLRED